MIAVVTPPPDVQREVDLGVTGFASVNGVISGQADVVRVALAWGYLAETISPRPSESLWLIRSVPGLSACTSAARQA